MSASITSITGLQNLINLQAFNASGNSLITIDLSGLTNLTYVDLGYNNITLVDNITLPNSLELLNLGGNQIVTFNPTLALPSGLTELYLDGNQIVIFNPSNPLPDSLIVLTLSFNLMTLAGYTSSEPWANAMSVIPGRGSIDFSSNPDSVSGTDLETILIAKGWTV
jgi:Leucine-rich repeat (LRR) protein